MGRTRLDQLLVDRGLIETRSKAQAVIMAGLVFSDSRRMDKAGAQVADTIELEIRGQDHPWVSRGGLKLDHGLSHFKIDLTGSVCLDIGASTGGFTDVALTRGAAKVYAVDVGHGQFAWKLRQDDRVHLLERTNARHLTRDLIADEIDFICCDASFIGLETILPASLTLAGPDAKLIALIKPQFEVGKGLVGKKGVVRDPALHGQVCNRISDWLNHRDRWRVKGIVESPITGPEGNKEFLIGAERSE